MPEQSAHHDNVWSSRAKWAFSVFAIIGAFLLIAEHRAHVLPYLPWLLLAACPLMHFFMHGSHGGHEGHHGGGGSGQDAGGSRGAASEPEESRETTAAPRQGDQPHHRGRP